jgi:hypothetical protein
MATLTVLKFPTAGAGQMESKEKEAELRAAFAEE